MKRSRLLLLALVILLIISGDMQGNQSAQPSTSRNSSSPATGWVEHFTSNQLGPRWTSQSRDNVSQGTKPGLNRNRFADDHIQVGRGYLQLTLTQQQTPDGIESIGAEIASVEQFQYGTFEFCMRGASTATSPTGPGTAASGSISAGFLYADNSATEADIEIEGQRPNEAQATTWTSEQTSQDHQPINTAASSRLVVYKIVWAPQGIQYYADGRLFVPIGTPLRPTVPAQLLFNLWGTNSGEFGGPVTTGATRSLFVTWVRYTPPGATPLPLA